MLEKQAKRYLSSSAKALESSIDGNKFNTVDEIIVKKDEIKKQ